MAIKISDLDAITTPASTDIAHVRNASGLDKKITYDNFQAPIAGAGRTTETIKQNADDIAANAANLDEATKPYISCDYDQKYEEGSAAEMTAAMLTSTKMIINCDLVETSTSNQRNSIFQRNAKGQWERDTATDDIATNSNGSGVLVAMTSTLAAYVSLNNEYIYALKYEGGVLSYTSPQYIDTASNAIKGACRLNDTDIAILDDTTNHIRAYTFNGTTWSVKGTAISLTIANGQSAIWNMNADNEIAVTNSAYQIQAYTWNGSTFSTKGNASAALPTSSTYRVGCGLTTSIAIIISQTLNNIEAWEFDGTDWTLLKRQDSFFRTGNVPSSGMLGRISDTEFFRCGTNESIATFEFDGVDTFSHPTDALDELVNTKQMEDFAYLTPTRLATYNEPDDEVQIHNKVGGQWIRDVAATWDSSVATSTNLNQLARLNDTHVCFYDDVNDDIYALEYTASTSLVTAGSTSSTISAFGPSGIEDNIVGYDAGVLNAIRKRYRPVNNSWVTDSSIGHLMTATKYIVPMGYQLVCIDTDEIRVISAAQNSLGIVGPINNIVSLSYLKPTVLDSNHIVYQLTANEPVWAMMVLKVVGNNVEIEFSPRSDWDDRTGLAKCFWSRSCYISDGHIAMSSGSDSFLRLVTFTKG